MKRGKGIKDKDDRSSGINILMVDVFVQINPTEPFRLDRQVAQRKRNWSDSSGIYYRKEILHGDNEGKVDG